MTRKTKAKQATAPIVTDFKPLIEKTEQLRTDASLVTYTLPEEERLALIAKYGAPIMPLKKRYDGKEVMALMRPAKDPKNTRKRA